MAALASVAVDGLFGTTNHVVDFPEGGPVIITAPNGAGKTHLLRLVAAVLTLDRETLASVRFDSVRLGFDDGAHIRCDKRANESGRATLVLTAQKDQSLETLELPLLDPDDERSRLPSHLRRIDHNRWHDLRTDRVMSDSAVRRRYARAVDLDSLPLIRDLVGGERAYLIDTKRLDSEPGDARQLRFWEREQTHPRNGEAHRIRHYLRELQQKVGAARTRSVSVAQNEDVSFATRALAAAGLTVSDRDLKRRYARLFETHQDLAKNSLAVGHSLMEFPAKTTPTIRRILHVFFDDMERRQSPLLPINALVNALREVLDSKLSSSGKRTSMTGKGELRILGPTGRNIETSQLSSGEQHLVALFTMLLFGASRGSVVLIDEPEISLHAAWKHAFLDDIERLAGLNDVQIVIATHSTAIINGRWDLTRELTFNVEPVSDEALDQIEDAHDDEFADE